MICECAAADVRLILGEALAWGWMCRAWFNGSLGTWTVRGVGIFASEMAGGGNDGDIWATLIAVSLWVVTVWLCKLFSLDRCAGVNFG